MSSQPLHDGTIVESSRRHIRGIATALAAFVLAVLVISPWMVQDRAQAVTNGVIGIRPAAESDFVHLSLYPGAATDAVAIVSNQSSEPVTLQIYAVDGQGTPQGTFAFGAQGVETETVGQWITLAVDEVTISPQSEIPVEFTVSVPAGTPPGDYAGGLIIQPPAVVGEVTDVGDGTALRLDVVQRQGLRVYLEVAGTAIPALATGVLTWEQHEGVIRFSLPVENTGNTILHPTGGLSLSGAIGGTEQLAFVAPESVLPGATFTMIAELPAPLAQWGSAQATVESEAGVTSASTEFVLIPWVILAVVAVGLVIAGLVIARTVRFVRRARVALAHAQMPVTELPSTVHRVPVSDLTRVRDGRRSRARSRVRGRSPEPAAPVPSGGPRHRR